MKLILWGHASSVTTLMSKWQSLLKFLRQFHFLQQQPLGVINLARIASSRVCACETDRMSVFSWWRQLSRNSTNGEVYILVSLFGVRSTKDLQSSRTILSSQSCVLCSTKNLRLTGTYVAIDISCLFGETLMVQKSGTITVFWRLAYSGEIINCLLQ